MIYLWQWLRWQYSWTQSKKCKCIFKLCKKNFYTRVVLFNYAGSISPGHVRLMTHVIERNIEIFWICGFSWFIDKKFFFFFFFSSYLQSNILAPLIRKTRMKLVRPYKELSEKAAGGNWVHQHIGGIGTPGWGKADRCLVWWPVDYPWTRKIPQQDITANQMTELIRIMLFAAQNRGHQLLSQWTKI